MKESILNIILLRSLRARRIMEKFLRSIESEFAEEFLEMLLNLMQLVLLINKDFRKNIKNFKGKYLFRSADNSITVSAVFKNNKMKVSKKEIDDTDVTVNFRDGKALLNYLLSPKTDIHGSILRQDVRFDGNLNYLYKFAYMSKRLQLMATGQI